MLKYRLKHVNFVSLLFLLHVIGGIHPLVLATERMRKGKRESYPLTSQTRILVKSIFQCVIDILNTISTFAVQTNGLFTIKLYKLITFEGYLVKVKYSGIY